MTEVKPVMKMRLIHGKTYELVFERGVVFAAGQPTMVIVDEVRGDPSKLGPCGIDACCCDSEPKFEAWPYDNVFLCAKKRSGISGDVQRPDNVEVKKSP